MQEISFQSMCLKLKCKSLEKLNAWMIAIGVYRISQAMQKTWSMSAKVSKVNRVMQEWFQLLEKGPYANRPPFWQRFINVEASKDFKDSTCNHWHFRDLEWIFASIIMKQFALNSGDLVRRWTSCSISLKLEAQKEQAMVLRFPDVILHELKRRQSVWH